MNISDKTKYLLLKGSIEGLRKHLNTISTITQDDLEFIKNYLDYTVGVTDGVTDEKRTYKYEKIY